MSLKGRLPFVRMLKCGSILKSDARCERNRLHTIARNSNSESAIRKYKEEKNQRNHLNNVKKHTKEQFYLNADSVLDEFAGSNSNSYWSIIKRLVKCSKESTLITQLKKQMMN